MKITECTYAGPDSDGDINFQATAAIENKTEHMCNGELSLHVLDIIQSIMKSADTKKEFLLSTECGIPKAFTQDKIKKILK